MAMCPRFLLPLQGSGSEPANAAPGGGRPSPCLALPCPQLKMVHRLDTRLCDLRTVLCLLRKPAEGNAIYKQRMAHWMVNAITLAF